MKQLLGIILGLTIFGINAKDLEKPLNAAEIISMEKKPTAQEILGTKESFIKGSLRFEKKREELNAALIKENYNEVERILGAIGGVDEGMLSWLHENSNRGSIPIAWIYAQKLGNINSISESINWLYVAYLGSLQEESLCRQKGGIKKVSIKYGKIIEIARKNPGAVKGAKKFAFEKLNLWKKNNHWSPAWICGEKNGEILAIPKINWEKRRESELRLLEQKFSDH